MCFIHRARFLNFSLYFVISSRENLLRCHFTCWVPPSPPISCFKFCVLEAEKVTPSSRAVLMLRCRGGHPSKAGAPIPALECHPKRFRNSVPNMLLQRKLHSCFAAGGLVAGSRGGWKTWVWGWGGTPVPQGLWALTQLVCDADPSLLVLLLGANADSSWNVNTLPFHSFSLKDSPCAVSESNFSSWLILCLFWSPLLW